MNGRIVKTLLDVKPGDLVFDVGANVGDFTAGLVLCGCRVIALEPQTAVHQILYERYKRIPQVKCVCAAVSDHEGTGEINIVGQGTYLSQNVHIANPFIPVVGNFPKQACPLITLDRLIVKYGLPKAIKIDVEGFEPQVLRGLSRPIHSLSLEIHSVFIEKMHICIEILERLGRYKYNLRREGTADQLTFDTFYPLSQLNVLTTLISQTPNSTWDLHALLDQ